MKATKRIYRRLAVLVVFGVAYAAIWSYNPIIDRVRQRFPSATIEDCYEGVWVVPPFLRARFPGPTDVFDGGYLSITISDQAVDLKQFNDLPFFLLNLNRCTVFDLKPLAAMNSNRAINFNDCDLSAVPSTQLGKVADAQHSSFTIGGP